MIARPGQLPPSSGRTPAMRALQKMCDRWAALALSWGPAGSVGFELATGRRVTNEESDLDLVVRAPQRIAFKEARFLLDRTLGLEVKANVAGERAYGGLRVRDMC